MIKVEGLSLAQVEKLIEKGRRYKETNIKPLKKLREKKGRIKSYGHYW